MIKCDVADRLARIAFARAGEGNAFTGDMIRQLRDAIRDCDGRADILTLAGEGADFTVGRDRKEPMSGPPFDAFSLITDLNESLSGFRGIVISAVRGRAFGLGVGLIMRSDLAIASEDAVFALDEVKLGIPPMFVMAAIVDHMAPKRALDVILTSREFPAKEALDIGCCRVWCLPPSSMLASRSSSATFARATARCCGPASAICTPSKRCRSRRGRRTR